MNLEHWETLSHERGMVDGSGEPKDDIGYEFI
jgi:hypothetical protein